MKADSDFKNVMKVAEKGITRHKIPTQRADSDFNKTMQVTKQSYVTMPAKAVRYTGKK